MTQTTFSKRYLPVVLLFLLSLIWGASFLLIKKGLNVFSPVEVMAIRALIASLILMPLAIKSFKNIPKEKWKYVLVLGIIGNLIPAYLFAKAETEITSAMAGMLNSVTPILTLLLGILFFKAKWVSKQLFGIIIGFLGAVFIIYVSTDDIGVFNWHAVLIIMATLCYAISTNTLNRYFDKSTSVADITVAQLSVIAIPSVFFLLFSDFSTSIQKDGALEAIGYLAILAIMGTIFGMWLFNKIVQVKSAIFAISVTYLIPFAAICFGVLTGELVTIEQFLGVLLIISGVFLINKN